MERLGAAQDNMENVLRKKAKDLLSSGEVKVVIGYGFNRRGTHVTPVFITKPEDADKLVFNPRCVNNLSVYLTRKFKDIHAIGRPAIVAKGCDIKNVVVLIAEAQLKREDVYIIGMACNGIVYRQELWKGELKPEIMPTKCANCDVRYPHLYDCVLGDKPALSLRISRFAWSLTRLPRLTRWIAPGDWLFG